MIRLHCNIGRHFKAGSEVADDVLVEAVGEEFVQNLVRQRLAEKVGDVVILADGVTPDFAQALAAYVATLADLTDRLVVVLDLTDPGSDAEAIALVDAMRSAQAEASERVGLRVQELFWRAEEASRAELEKLNTDLAATAHAATDPGGDVDPALRSGATSEAAASAAASTTIDAEPVVSGDQTTTAEPVEPAAVATDTSEAEQAEAEQNAPVRKGGRKKSEA